MTTPRVSMHDRLRLVPKTSGTGEVGGAPGSPSTPHLPTRTAPGDLPPYLSAALASAAGRVTVAAEGTRNHTLNAEVYSLARYVGAGELTEEAVGEALLPAARACGLPDSEAIATIKSALRGGKANPKAVPERPVVVAAEPKVVVEEWRTPDRLGPPDPPPFPTDALGPLQAFAEQLADTYQVPVDLPGVLLLSALSAAVGASVVVQVTKTWVEPLNLYTAVALPPGEGKSPVFKAVFDPLREFEREWAARLAGDVQAAEDTREILEGQVATAKRAAIKAGRGPKYDEAMADLEDARTALDAAPKLVSPRMFADDITPEALIALLADQGGTLALVAAEGGIFATLAGRYSNSVPNLDGILKAHDGREPIRVDRKGAAPIYVERPCLTFGLAIQPRVLAGLADKPEFRDRGVVARFLYSVPESRVGTRDMALDRPAHAHVGDVGEVLRRIATHRVGDAGEVTRCSVDKDSIYLLEAFRTELEARRGPDGDLAGMLDWSAKLDGQTIRLAGLLSLANVPHIPHMSVGADQMRAAITLARYFIEHAKAALRVMDGRDSDHRTGLALLRWARRRGLAEFSERDAWQGLKGGALWPDATAVTHACAVLVDHGYLRRLPDLPTPKGGQRPSPRYAVNPLNPEAPQ